MGDDATPQLTAPHRLLQLPVWRVVLWGGIVALGLTNVMLGIEDLDGSGADLLPQWTLARLAVTGAQANTYDYATQASMLRSLDMPPHRCDLLVSPQIYGIGVCPYPPIMVVLFAPLGWLSFDGAILAVYLASIVLTFVSAVAISRATDGRVSALEVAAAILWYPGFHFNLQLGQNGLLTLAIWSLGWLAVVRRRDLLAGLVWGLLAYKVQWLFAVAWLPLVMRRPRVWLGMALTGGVLVAAATLWLGPDVWLSWFTQIKAVDAVYAHDADFRERLLGMSCDLRGLVYRYWPLGLGRAWPVDPVRLAAWAAIGLVVVVTALRYRRPSPTGAAAPGLLFACGLSVPHLYYYDEVVFLLPLLVFWSQRRLLAWWQIAILVILTAGHYGSPLWMMYRRELWDGAPTATFVVLGLWMLSLTVTLKEE